ncbi:MAG: S-layer homology domain-containing protein [Candidatus Riflebacteria bacterium]|nr:S-layer homology domain-containing protein [Candidatus Riflebacteria bacterium]
MLKRLVGTSILVVVLCAPGLARPRGGDLRLADVPGDHWAVDHIRRVTAAGLMQTYDGKFLGNTSLTRYQTAQMLSRLMDRMGNQPIDRNTGGPSSEITIQLADEVASLNVAHSNLEEKVVQLRHDLEAVREGNGGGGHHGGPPPPRITPDEWNERLRTQAPAAFAALLLFASAGFVKTFK